MSESATFEAWRPHLAEAQKGLIELRGWEGRKMHRGQIPASNEAFFTMRDVCRFAVDAGLDSNDIKPRDPVEIPPALDRDQIADYALAKGLEAFDKKQAWWDFTFTMVQGGMLEHGVELSSGVGEG